MFSKIAHCVTRLLIASLLAGGLAYVGRALVQVSVPTQCDYLDKLAEALLGISCMSFAMAAYYFVKALGWLLLLAAALAGIGAVSKCVSAAASSGSLEYGRILLNRIEAENQSWFHRFEGPKKNSSDDCVIAAISGVKVPGGYDSALQPVASGATFKVSPGEDLDGFIHRDGSIRKFKGAFGGWPLVGEEFVSPQDAKESFKQYWQEAMNWFSDHPDC